VTAPAGKGCNQDIAVLPARELPVRDFRASGSAMRQRLGEWRNTAVLPRVHAVLLRMAWSDPETAARIARLFADAGYDSADNRWLCLRESIRPLIREIGSGHVIAHPSDAS
jgi:hypothetical protein